MKVLRLEGEVKTKDRAAGELFQRAREREKTVRLRKVELAEGTEREEEDLKRVKCE